MNKVHALSQAFRAKFGGEPSIYRAPGRVNLIGEHTDYNQGFVLPAAIGFSCWVAIAARSDDRLLVYSENFNETVEARIEGIARSAAKSWADYALGVAWALREAGHRLSGANLYIAGDVPLGAGLSSSAAVEVSTGYALLSIADEKIDLTKLAQLCQRAENEFVGARVGIMDQFVSCHGRSGHALEIDCRSLEYRALKIPPRVQLVICNTMMKHKLHSSEYNARRAECEEAVRALSSNIPGVMSLRDVTLSQLEQNRGLLSEMLYLRCRHIVTENQRVHQVARLFKQGTTNGLKEVMAESHRSLRDDYEVSSRELDTMVEIASRQPGVYGARMTGGGFGGCTINFVDIDSATEFQRQVSADYEKATGLRPDIYICEASQGAELVEAAPENAPKVSQ